MKIVFKFDFLTYLYHNNSFFQFMYHYDTLMLPLTILMTFVCFFNGWYVPMLISSIFLLLFNTFFIFELPFLPVQLLSGYAADYTWLRIVALLVGIWGLFRAIKEVKTMVLDNERVIEKNLWLVEQGAGREQWVLDQTEELIKETKLPGILTSQEDISSGLFGEKRKFLVVRHARYKEYRMVIGARSYGQHLDAGVFLVVEPSFFKRTVSKHTTGNPTALSQKLDFFSQQDLGAFSAIVRHSFERVLEMLHEELKLDPSSMYNTQSKGFLNVW